MPMLAGAEFSLTVIVAFVVTGAVVSRVKARLAAPGPVPRPVVVARMVWAPSASAGDAKLQVPSPAAIVLPSAVVPSNRLTVAPAAAVPSSAASEVMSSVVENPVSETSASVSELSAIGFTNQ